MAVKASVNNQNQTTVRVGQQNAIRVGSTSAAISSAETATTAVNVVGGRADVTQLEVSGLSTFTGIGTFVSDLYVGGDLYLTDDLVLDNITGNSLKIVGISTLGITSATHLEAQQLSISGVSTFNEDVKFTGNDTNMRWNHDTSDLTLYDSTRLEFGDNKDFEIWHGGSHTFMKNSGGDLRIRGDKILLKRADDTERYLEANVNNEVKLFFNGVEKFATSLEGVEVGNVAISTIGIVTASSGIVTYYGDGSKLSGLDATALKDSDGNVKVQAVTTGAVVTGLITATTGFSGDITGVGATFTDVTGTLQTAAQTNITSLGTLSSLSVNGDVSIGGTLTYEDVTNVDSVGLVTAREGIHVISGAGVSIAAGGLNVSSGITTVGFATATDVWVSGAVTATKFYGDGTNLTGIATAVDGVIVGTGLSISGISTFAGITTVTGHTLFTEQLSVSGITTTSTLKIGTGITANAGIITANSIDAAISEWVLGYYGNDHYTITGPGLTGTENDPTIYLKRGQKYRFKNASGGHPFRIQYTFQEIGGSAYNDGITNNPANDGDTLVWDVQFDTPDILYYQCTSHGPMSGKIYIGNSGESSTIHNLSVTGISTLGITSATNLEAQQLNVTGISTLGITSATNLEAQQLNVTGISTFAGIATVTGNTLFTKQLSVSGLSTYIGVATYKSNVFIDGTLTAGAIDGGTY